MTSLFALVIILVVAVVAVAASGRLGQLADPIRDRPHPPEPKPPLSAAALPALRFGTAFRGYRMDDVDAAVVALTETLRIREAQLAAMSGAARTQPTPPDPDSPNPHPWSNGL